MPRFCVAGVVFGALLSLGASSTAHGETNVPRPKEQRPAPPRTGFQMHVVPGTSFVLPFGSATGAGGDNLDARYSWHWVPAEIGLGGKITEALYVGGYLDVSVGAEGDDPQIENQCEDSDTDFENDVSCASATVGVGIELRYSLAPGQRTAPWLGLGVGFTSAWQTISDDVGYSETVALHGLDLARLSAGLDWRVSKGFGFGPYVTGAIGRYDRTNTAVGNIQVHNGDVSNTAIHSWIALGLRVVILP